MGMDRKRQRDMARTRHRDMGRTRTKAGTVKVTWYAHR